MSSEFLILVSQNGQSKKRRKEGRKERRKMKGRKRRQKGGRAKECRKVA